MNKLKKILLFIIMFIGMILFPYIPIKLFHIDLNSLSEKMKVLFNFACNVGYILIIIMIYYKKNITELKEYIKNFKKYFKESINYYIIGLIIMYLSNIIIATFFSSANANNEIAVKQLIDMYPVYMLFSTIIYAPIVEETIFRRSIKDIITSYSNKKIAKYTYIITSGLLFSLMHVIGMVDTNLDYLYIIPYLSLGIAFAALYYKTDNLFTTITLHSLHNLVAILLYFMIGV